MTRVDALDGELRSFARVTRDQALQTAERLDGERHEVRVSRMQDYVDEVNRRLTSHYEDVHNFTFGHMGDGNLHFVVSVGAGGPEHRRCVEACVYEPLRDIAGSVSAEHGVGSYAHARLRR